MLCIHINLHYNSMEDQMNIEQNLFRNPLNPSMSAKVEFYSFMTKEASREKHSMKYFE